MDLYNRVIFRKRIYAAACATLLMAYSFAGIQLASAVGADIIESSAATTTVVTEPTETIPVTIPEPTVPETTPPEPTIPETTVPETEPPTIEPPETEPSISYFDIPLSDDLQNYIFELCENHGVDPSVIVSMIFRESCFKPEAIGDGGNSLGLMQLQPRWFLDRMAELGITQCYEGCPHDTCLLNPYQNVTLGVEWVGQLYSTGKPLVWILMAHNGGEVNADNWLAEGTITNYAIKVLEYMDTLERRSV